MHNKNAIPPTLGKSKSKVPTVLSRAILRNIRGVEYLVAPSPSIGKSEKQIVYRHGPLTLRHYKPLASEIFRIPILIVMATSNRGDILDVTQGLSFVEHLLEQGFDVFMVAWEAPRPEEKVLSLDQYAFSFISESIDRVEEITGQSDVTLMGYCMGGILSAIYAGTAADDRIANLVCFTTPVRMQKMDHLFSVASSRHLDIDQMIDRVGNVPASFVDEFMVLVEPGRSTGRNLDVINNLWNKEYISVHRHISKAGTQTLPLAGEFARQVLHDIVMEDKLCLGTLNVAGHTSDLSKIEVPLLHVIGDKDKFVPYKASAPLVELASSTDKTELIINGGHAGLVVGPPAVKRMWPHLIKWLSERSE